MFFFRPIVFLMLIQLSSSGFQQTYLKASNTGNLDRFGTAVAIDGDTLVVGAFREDSGGSGVNGAQDNDDVENSGAVYVYVRDGDSWVQEAYLKASNPGTGDYFGNAVAISGDTIVVGADRESSGSPGVNGDESNNSISRAGAAYVFIRVGGIWSQQAYLKASNPGVKDAFGYNVAIEGDLIAVGAYLESSPSAILPNDDSAPNAGAVYLFRRMGSKWSQEAFLKADNAEAGDGFGISVAISGETLVVGAEYEDGDAIAPLTDSGSAYVFVRENGLWSQQGFLRASNAGAGDLFGQAVDIEGDILVVGAPLEGSSATGVNPPGGDDSLIAAGAVYLFKREGSLWSETTYLKAINSGGTSLFDNDGDHFGTSVGLSGGQLFVGAYGEDSSSQGFDGDPFNDDAIGSGAAYLYLLQDSTVTFSKYFKAINAGAGDGFGRVVAISGQRLVIGARGEDSLATGVNQFQEDGNEEETGAAYVIDPDPIVYPTVITGVSQIGLELSVTFTGSPNQTDWEVFGDPVFPLSSDLSSSGVLLEVMPGAYQLLVTLNQPESRYFVQVNR